MPLTESGNRNMLISVQREKVTHKAQSSASAMPPKKTAATEPCACPTAVTKKKKQQHYSQRRTVAKACLMSRGFASYRKGNIANNMSEA